MNFPNNNEVCVEVKRPLRSGWVAVSVSPQGTYYLSEENPHSTITTNIDDAAIFDNYENAFATLDNFKDSVFIETEKQQDIIHFFRIEKTEWL